MSSCAYARAVLASEGCVAGVSLHQLWLGDQRLDIVPFGGVERPGRAPGA